MEKIVKLKTLHGELRMSKCGRDNEEEVFHPVSAVFVGENIRAEIECPTLEEALELEPYVSGEKTLTINI